MLRVTRNAATPDVRSAHKSSSHNGSGSSRYSVLSNEQERQYKNMKRVRTYGNGCKQQLEKKLPTGSVNNDDNSAASEDEEIEMLRATLLEQIKKKRRLTRVKDAESTNVHRITLMHRTDSSNSQLRGVEGTAQQFATNSLASSSLVKKSRSKRVSASIISNADSSQAQHESLVKRRRSLLDDEEIFAPRNCVDTYPSQGSTDISR
ncbi:hypothetical protein Tcan_02956 [Toxocara canis]|uniref:Uncharacterized protein n=1 Tax=Toxocara canis TaxID=6265 RepID=A0A0B2W5Q3_TOXCA|nr:hypothetical protein Tcan_02956 [Toxocara canis]